MGVFEIYKRTQGKHTRSLTFAAGMVLNLYGAYWLSERLSVFGNVLVQFLIPLGVAAAITWLLYWLVNKPSMADFLIATEGEMKKVAWSHRREVIGSTKVVVFTTLTLAVMLFFVDIMFQKFFSFIKVLRITT